MVRKTGWHGVVLWPVVLVGLPAILATIARGDVTTGNETAPLVRVDPFPEPPRQHDDWKPPATKVPRQFVFAVRMLFEQGFADPRGCDYCEIEVQVGDFREHGGGIARTHGWVLPIRAGDERRFAVCWNGLVYPLLSAGKGADLDQDVKAKIERLTKNVDPNEDGWQPQTTEGWCVWHRSLGNHSDLATAVLLRLGKGDLASELWAADHPESQEDGRGASEKSHPYLGLSSRWARFRLERVMDAYRRGDDSLAMHDLRQLTAFAREAETTAKLLGFEPDNNRRAHLDFLELLPALRADLERRAKEGPHNAVVCIGPGRHPDANKRIAALIARLDEVNGRQFQPFGHFFVENDPVVQALIREGPPALEPLLKCFEEDRRLTRAISIDYDRERFPRGAVCPDVRWPASVAIDGILEQAYFPSHMPDNLPLRDQVKAAQWLPPAERCFKMLAEDGAPPHRWGWAARLFVAPDRAAMPGPAGWSRQRRGEEPSKVLGEPLRDKIKPSVTELMLRRIGQANNDKVAAYLALALAKWEPQAAQAPLADLTFRLREKENWPNYINVIEARCASGDRGALDDYVTLMRTVTPTMFGSNDYSNLFYPMMRHGDHPGMAEAAEALFANADSPWLPLLPKGDADSRANNLKELIPTRLLRLPAFRKAVIKELGNMGGDGTVTVDPTGSMSINLPAITNTNVRGYRYRDNDVPEEGARGTFRICDYVAWEIGREFAAAPRCELYWPEDKRDKAVRACAEFLRRYGDHLFEPPDIPKRDKPATAKEVQEGKAIFSLAGEGEARVVPGLNLPLDTRWVTLKNRPHQEKETDLLSGEVRYRVRYRQDGRVVQAEEVFKDGKWQRYYGFVGCNHVARVPADEIEFPAEKPDWDEQREWLRIGPGLDARLAVPPLRVELIDDYPPRLPADAALTFGLIVRNARGLEQPSPVPEKSVRLRLLYSPEVVSRQGALVPQAEREADWKPLTPKPGAAFKAEKDKTLAPTEEMKTATFNLREWFDVSKPGFYRLQLVPAVEAADEGGETAVEVRFSLAAPERKPGFAK